MKAVKSQLETRNIPVFMICMVAAGVGYGAFHELEFAHENELCELWPPASQNKERGTCQNRFVFEKSLVFAEYQQMTSAKGVADQIADSVARLGIFRN